MRTLHGVAASTRNKPRVLPWVPTFVGTSGTMSWYSRYRANRDSRHKAENLCRCGSGSERALVLRDAQLCCAPQDENCRIVVACRDGIGFLICVALRSGQIHTGIACVPITGGRRRGIWRVKTTFRTSSTRTRSIAVRQSRGNDGVINPCARVCAGVMRGIMCPHQARSTLASCFLHSREPPR